MDVEESRLPLLLQRMLPGGWDALGRPWALMDCPAEQVPQLSSAHDQPRVTAAVLVSFFPGASVFSEQKAHGMRTPGLEKGQTETTSRTGRGDTPGREPKVSRDYLPATDLARLPRQRASPGGPEGDPLVRL